MRPINVLGPQAIMESPGVSSWKGRNTFVSKLNVNILSACFLASPTLSTAMCSVI